MHYNQLVEIAKYLHVLIFVIQKACYATYTNISLALAYTYLHSLAMTVESTKLDSFLGPLTPPDVSQIKLYNYYFKTLEYVATEVDGKATGWSAKFVNGKWVSESAKKKAKK